MADVSISTLVQRVRDLLNDTASYQTTSTTTNTSSPVAVPDGTLWVQGDVGEWQTGTVGYEQFWNNAAPTANNLSVVRGYNGTTAEAHTSGDIIVQNPVYAGRAIQQALQRAVDMLWPHAYKTTDIPLMPDSTTDWYDLDSLTRGIVKAYQRFGDDTPETGVFIGYAGDVRSNASRPIQYDEDLPTDVASTGIGVRFPGGLYDADNDIHVIDKRVITGTSDIPDDGELPVAECVVYLAAARLLEGAELQRVSQGTDLEETGSIGTGSRLSTGMYFRRIGKEKLDELESRLRRKYRPLRFWR